MEIIDKIFAESIRKAIRDFGPDILLERRFIGILKDYQGFRLLAPAELITRILIESGAIRRIHALRSQELLNIDEFLKREIAGLELQYGFAEKFSRKTLYSLLDGIGVNAVAEIEVTERKNQPAKPEPSKKNIELTKTTSAPYKDNTSILDIRRIPTGKNYLDLREELRRQSKGIILTDYKSNDGKKYALFSCDIIPFRKVEIKVVSENSWNTASKIQISVLNRLSKDFKAIREDVGKINTMLDCLYASERPTSVTEASNLSDSMLFKRFNIAQKKEESIVLRSYYLKEGAVTCKLHFTHNGYSIAIDLYPQVSSGSTGNSNAWPLPPSPVPIPLPSDPINYYLPDSYDEDYEVFEEEEEEDDEYVDFDDYDEDDEYYDEYDRDDDFDSEDEDGWNSW